MISAVRNTPVIVNHVPEFSSNKCHARVILQRCKYTRNISLDDEMTSVANVKLHGTMNRRVSDVKQFTKFRDLGARKRSFCR
jgi:hypothetical protein